MKLCSVRETSTKRDLFLLTAFFNCEWPLKALPQNTVALEQRKLFCCTQFKVKKKNSNTVYKTDNETNVDSPSRMLAS